MDDRTQRPRLQLVPRLSDQGYRREQVDRRRGWVRERTGASLEHVGRFSISSEAMRGNVENPIGAAQVPIGVAGPLLVTGQHARGTFYVPLATTEGALVRSYERGMVAITKSGGARARIYRDENRVSPLFTFDDVDAAFAFASRVEAHVDELRAAAGATTRHGRLLGVSCLPVGRELIVDMRFTTGDAQGMNMIVRAADAACRWLREHLDAPPYSIFSGYDGEKRAAGALLAGGKGKTVTAGARLPADVLSAVLHTTPAALASIWRRTVLGHLRSGALGYNGHYANGLTAIFIATGQDVANVTNAALGITDFAVVDARGSEALEATVTLTALTVATVGGGTGQGTARECLEMLGCAGAEKDGGGARKLAEIVAATLLAGELSMGAAIASGELVAAHETYGRNRPREEPAS